MKYENNLIEKDYAQCYYNITIKQQKRNRKNDRNKKRSKEDLIGKGVETWKEKNQIIQF